MHLSHSGLCVGMNSCRQVGQAMKLWGFEAALAAHELGPNHVAAFERVQMLSC